RSLAGGVPEMALERFQRVAGLERNQMAEAKVAVQRACFEITSEAVQMTRVIDEHEQAHRAALAAKLSGQPLDDLDFRGRSDLDGDDAGIGGVAEQQAIFEEELREFLITIGHGSPNQILHRCGSVE